MSTELRQVRLEASDRCSPVQEIFVKPFCVFEQSFAKWIQSGLVEESLLANPREELIESLSRVAEGILRLSTFRRALISSVVYDSGRTSDRTSTTLV